MVILDKKAHLGHPGQHKEYRRKFIASIWSSLSSIYRIATSDTNNEQRPPGTMVIGWPVLVLSGNEKMPVLDDYDKGLDEKKGIEVVRWE